MVLLRECAEFLCIRIEVDHLDLSIDIRQKERMIESKRGQREKEKRYSISRVS